MRCLILLEKCEVKLVVSQNMSPIISYIVADKKHMTKNDFCMKL
jgi:hypothetical protein